MNEKPMRKNSRAPGDTLPWEPSKEEASRKRQPSTLSDAADGASDRKREELTPGHTTKKSQGDSGKGSFRAR